MLAEMRRLHAMRRLLPLITAKHEDEARFCEAKLRNPNDCRIARAKRKQSVGIITKWLGAPPNHENVVICSANRQIPPIPSVSFYKNSLKKQKVEKRSFKIHQSNI